MSWNEMQYANVPIPTLQVDHQDWERGNLNLKIAFQRGTPVRVCRGAKV